MKFILLSALLLFTHHTYANSCTHISDESAKKIFLTLYPFSQSKVTALEVIEKENTLIIKTISTTCEVQMINAKNQNMNGFKNHNPKHFKCSFKIYSDGAFGPCEE